MPEFALLSYVVLMSITPGPNNLMLASSGVNFGFRRSLPHMLGISLGCAVQVFIVALLLASALDWVQILRMPLAAAGCLYLFYLSWRIAQAGRLQTREAARPLGFVGAAAFQWLNPKAWVMVVNASILFMPASSEGRLLAAALLALVFAALNLPCISVWAWAGQRLQRWLEGDAARRRFNLTMGWLMAATACWLLLDELRPLWGAWANWPELAERVSVMGMK